MKGVGLGVGVGVGKLPADFDVTVGVDLLADEAQGGLEVARGGLEGVGIDRERSAEDDERGAVFRAAHGLFEGEATIAPLAQPAAALTDVSDTPLRSA